MITRGVRNKNPGNIDHNASNHWQGELPVDTAIEARFCRFDTPENGIRALTKILLTYQNKYGLKTVDAIISRWAPGVENDTDSYVKSVESRLLGHKPDSDVNLSTPSVMKAFVVAIIAHENANYKYPDTVVNEGVRRGLI